MQSKTSSFCEIAPSGNRVSARTRLMRHRGKGLWEGVRTEKYKVGSQGTWQSVIRRVLVGASGEKTKFHLRYFEIAPGGHTTYERHKHEHVVVGIRGKGRCLAGSKTYTIALLDALYIAPDDPHQLANPYAEPFGFFCLVNARRDRPKPILKPKRRGK